MAYAFSQQKSNYTNSGTPSTAQATTFTTNNVAGNILILYIGWTTNVTVTSITDSNNNAWVSVPQLNNGTVFGQLWYVLSCAAGANTVTAHFSSTGATFIDTIIAEYTVPSNAPSPTALDQTGTNNSGSTTAVTATTIGAPASSFGELTIFAASSSSVTWSASGNFTTRSTLGSQRAILTDWLAAAVSPGGTTITGTVTQGSGDPYVAQIVTFSPGSGLTEQVGNAVDVQNRFSPTNITLGNYVSGSIPVNIVT